MKESHCIQDGRCTKCFRKDPFLTLLSQWSIAQRISWAARRQTTRKEDQAYCLLGLFGVNMPLLYGEGDRAFIRLQEEIIKLSDDHSILAFAPPLHPNVQAKYTPVLAGAPQHFAYSKIVTPLASRRRLSHMVMTSKNLELELTLFRSDRESVHYGSCFLWLGLLNCHFEDDLASRPGILLIEEINSQRRTFRRVPGHGLACIGPHSAPKYQLP